MVRAHLAKPALARLLKIDVIIKASKKVRLLTPWILDNFRGLNYYINFS